MAASTNPPGWYPDPQSPQQLRWWDGAAWTAQTAPAGRTAPQPTAAAPIDRSLIRPRAWAFALLAIPAIAGIAAATALVLSAVDAGTQTYDTLTAPLTDLQAPGSAQIELRQGESRTIYAFVSQPSPNAAAATVANIRCQALAPSGRSDTISVDDNATLTRAADQYRSLYDFTAASAGTQRVTCQPRAGAGGPVALAVGQRIHAREIVSLVGSILGAIGSLLLGLALATAIGVWVAVARGRSEKRLRAQAAGVATPM